MKRLFSLLYWSVAAIVVALVLLSVGYDFPSALLMGVLFIPTAFATKFLGSKIRFNEGPKRWIWPILCLTASMLVLQYLLLFMANAYVLSFGVEYPQTSLYPSLLLNPVFLLLIMAFFVVPERLLSKRLVGRERYVDFVSDRRRVRVEIDAIACIESNDTEVKLHMADGTDWRTKAKISTWEKILDDRFLRVHRSFLVNRAMIEGADSKYVTVCGREIEVSRKYRETVRQRVILNCSTRCSSGDSCYGAARQEAGQKH